MDKRRVLLVDNDPETVWTIGRQLMAEGYSVNPFTDAEEGLKQLYQKNFDFLVVNIQMPEIDGLAFLKRYHGNFPKTKTIVLLDYDSPIFAETVLRHGANFYIQKPVDPKFLTNIISELDNKESFSGAVSNIDLLEYLQFILFTDQKKLLEITSRDEEKGKIYFDHGNVIHAECSEARGEEAFYRCLLFEGGNFFELPWEDPPERSISAPGEFLLMEAARIKDESKGNVKEEDPIDFGTLSNTLMSVKQ